MTRDELRKMAMASTKRLVFAVGDWVESGKSNHPGIWPKRDHESLDRAYQVYLHETDRLAAALEDLKEQPMTTHTVRVSSGKYTFVIDSKNTEVEVLRHGEEWVRFVTGFNALHSIMCELDAARVVVAAVREGVERGDVSKQSRLGQAIELHDRLVDDREHPSEWAVPSEPKEQV